MATSKFKDRNLEKDTLLNIGILQISVLLRFDGFFLKKSKAGAE